MAPPADQQAISIQPLTPQRWADFEELFGPKGAYGGCWCMWWRVTRAEFESCQGQGNRQAMRELVDSGLIPGLLAYQDGIPVAWCSVAPRQQFGSLNRSRILKPLDDQPVWSLVCLFIARGQRGQGLARNMLLGAIDYVRQAGGSIIEAYPTVPKGDNKLPPVSSFMGVPSLFASVGFVECARPSQARMIMRYYIYPQI